MLDIFSNVPVLKLNNLTQINLTLILTHLTTLCTFASQKAPLYLAETSVPTLR